ncbi:hypothetical protein [Pricia sp.]|uniref:hypothetical protein n=1 Tax=Pricia sp. TaxID=2268138 RepID=UPI003594181E
MKNMRLTIALLTLTLAINLTGCSKTDGLSPEEEMLAADQYFIKFKVNGKLKVFANDNVNSVVLGTFNDLADTGTGDQYASGIIGTNDLNGDEAYLSITFSTFEETLLNTAYTDYEPNDPKIRAATFIAIYTVDEIIYGSVDEVFSATHPKYTSDSEISFIEVGEKFTKGRFSGTWYNVGSNDPSLKITEGEFYVPRLKK